MKVLNKIVIVLLFTLVTFSALSVFTGSVNAAGNLSCQASISAKTSGVGQATSYTFTINNVGEANLGGTNITIPSGYSNVRNIVISQEPTSQNWTITKENNDILLYGSAEGLSSNQSITFTFDATNPKPSGNYKWIIGANENTSVNGLNAPEFTLDVSYPIVINSVLAATLIFFIATVIAFINTGINKVLINYFVGWEQYRVMQKEMNEYRSETMAAMRANDKKQVEKLKKKESQIKNMQAKMMKPQMVQFGFSFVYIIIWFFVLTPTFGSTSMAYVPGFGAIPVIYWYPIGSFFLGLLASRLIGIMPIET
jgi:uncharacterized membrane protein (DUF106 family)